MKRLLAMLFTLILLPGVALAAPDAGFWEACNSMMPGMGWMMLPMMITVSYTHLTLPTIYSV